MTTEATRRRRALARATHPDAGGSHEAFVAAMAAERSRAAGPAVTVVVRHPWRRRVRRVLRRTRGAQRPTTLL